jgi:protoporphyrinogen oxidase
MDGLGSVRLPRSAKLGDGQVKILKSQQKIAVIAGAGPAGLTAALELLRQSDIRPIVFEADTQVGGISKTINHRGNRMDLGGPRFFSKSDWVMRWWQEILPIAQSETDDSGSLRISYQGESQNLTPDNIASGSSHAVMLVRRRLSRIFYRRRFFDYPLALNAGTLANLGITEALKIGMSYAKAQLRRRSPETSLEEFLINRFGKRLYQTFFKGYTEKVWGVPCGEISAEWGSQRIKGLSIAKALSHTIGKYFKSDDPTQRHTETSLIERFLYPTLGPGQMWEEVARRVSDQRGQIHLRHRIAGIEQAGGKVTAVNVVDETTQLIRRVACDHFISTIPVAELVAFLQPSDLQIRRIASRLPYRDFMTVGLLLRRMKSAAGARDKRQANGMPPDNWIYVQETDVKIGRLQIFNNWSPAMVADPRTIWLGLEYFCRAGDDLWCMDDGQFVDFAAGELEKIGLINRRDVIDGRLVRVPKAYPAYFGTYSEFDQIRAYLDRFTNLYPIGRNGMHRYNNQDHSMLAAKQAVDSIVKGIGKQEIWHVNAEDAYHESLDESS